MIGLEVWECKVVELAQGEYVTKRTNCIFLSVIYLTNPYQFSAVMVEHQIS